MSVLDGARSLSAYAKATKPFSQYLSHPYVYLRFNEQYSQSPSPLWSLLSILSMNISVVPRSDVVLNNASFKQFRTASA